jgi:chaperone modulatory protein CbpM
VSYAIVRTTRLGLDDFAAAVGIHPELVRRLVTLGIVEADDGPAGELCFAPAQIAAVGRIQRLRAGFALNYAAIGLVTDLLDRIAALQVALTRARRSGG